MDGDNKVPLGTYLLNITPSNSGVDAIIEIDVDINSKIESFKIINAGSGYSKSNPPKVSLFDYIDFTIKIGNQYIAELREGQYSIGGNPQFTNNTDNNNYQSWIPNDLICEIENSMSNSILSDTKYCYSRKSWKTLPTSSTQTDIKNYNKDYPLLFTSRLMSQYPTIDSFSSSSSENIENYDTNSCKFNRIYFNNVLILKTTGSPTEDQLNSITPFVDSNGFQYSILKYDLIPGNDTNYILYCKLIDPLKTVSGSYWTGVAEGSMSNIFHAYLCHWEFLFATGINYVVNSASLFGFNKKNYCIPTQTNEISISHTSGSSTTLIPSGLAYSTENDYYLVGDPEYVVLSFRPKYGGSSVSGINDRVDSVGNSNIDRVFACLIYDTVQPAVLQDVSSGRSVSTINSISSSNNNIGTFVDNTGNGVEVLTGNSGSQNVSYSKPPGMLKAMKGSDFDRKVVEFPQPVAQIYNLNLRFTKFSKGAVGSEEELYNFHGKEHLLLFEITCGDLLTRKRC